MEIAKLNGRTFGGWSGEGSVFSGELPENGLLLYTDSKYLKKYIYLSIGIYPMGSHAHL